MLWWRLGGRRIRLLLWSVTWVDLYCRLKCFECLVHDRSEGKAMGQMWVKVFVYLLCTRHWQMQNQLDEWHFLPKVMPRLSLLKEFRKADERGSDKWEVQMQCEEPVRVEGPPALHPHLPHRPNEKSLEVNHRKWRRWTVPTGYYDLFFWY